MILDVIRQQVEALRRPLAAVVLSTLQRKSSPMLLLLHWHGFAMAERQRSPPLVAGDEGRLASLPSSALQLNQDWSRLEELDRQMLDAAWQLGAWDLVREEFRACSVAGAPTREAVACHQAFGDNPLDPTSESHLVTAAPDRSALRDTAARLGYVSWIFRPVAEGLWRGAGLDDSLLSDGSRLPPCPVVPRTSSASRRTFQLGRLDRISRV